MRRASSPHLNERSVTLSVALHAAQVTGTSARRVTGVLRSIASIAMALALVIPAPATASPLDKISWAVARTRHEQNDQQRVREQIERMEARARADERLNGARRGGSDNRRDSRDNRRDHDQNDMSRGTPPNDGGEPRDYGSRRRER